MICQQGNKTADLLCISTHEKSGIYQEVVSVKFYKKEKLTAKKYSIYDRIRAVFFVP